MSLLLESDSTELLSEQHNSNLEEPNNRLFSSFDHSISSYEPIAYPQNSISTLPASQNTFHLEYEPRNVDLWIDEESDTTETAVSFSLKPTSIVSTAEPTNTLLGDKKITKLSFPSTVTKSSFPNIFLPLSDKTFKLFRQTATSLSQLANNIKCYLQASPHFLATANVVLDVAGAVSESAHLASDRVSSAADRMLRAPFRADDPEERFKTRLAANGRWADLPLRCALASLTWAQLRLVGSAADCDAALGGGESEDVPFTAAMRTYLASLTDFFARVVGGSASATSQQPTVEDCAAWDAADDDDGRGTLPATDSGRAETGLPGGWRDAQWSLAARAEAGDLEAQFALARWFSPPAFHELQACEVCAVQFGPRSFRHHCRMCGRSLCGTHSPERREIPHFGFSRPVRCCVSCSEELAREAHCNQLHWRELRVKAYLSDALLPYTSTGVDTRVDKALRVVDCTLMVARKTLIFNYPVYLVLETISALRRFGMSGLAGVLLRKDFLYAVETLKRISGVDRMFGISLHELTACIYYKLALDRGLRGCDPDGELREHERHAEERRRLAAAGEGPAGDGADLQLDLNEAIRISPLALQAVYEESAVECQRVAQLQGWRTILCCSESAPEQPAYALFASHIGAGRKEACLAVRGTSSVHDLVTDIRAAPHRFPPPADQVADAMAGVFRPRDAHNTYGTASTAAVADANEGREGSQTDEFVPITRSQWEWTPDMSGGQRYACRGMALSAMWLLGQVGPSLVALADSGYEIILTGHSLGAGVACLLLELLRTRCPAVRAVVYGCPSCVDRETAEMLRPRVLSVVLRDDFICRVTPHSIRLLMRELVEFRSHVFRHLEQDWADAIERAGSLWAPRHRDATGRAVSEQSAGSTMPPQSPLHSTGTGNSTFDSKAAVGIGGDEQPAEGSPAAAEDGELVPEEAIPQLWLPGRLIHMCSARGRFVASAVDATLPTLRRIEVQGEMFADHSSEAIFDALLEARAVARCSAQPPPWTPYDRVDRCECCTARFTWHSTFRGEAQEYRERYNCRQCGRCVCGPCSQRRRPLPRLGLVFPSRICDQCYFRGDFA